jgi:hypothetical protein
MSKIIEKLEREEIPLTSTVDRDEFITASEMAFDCRFDGTSVFYPWKRPNKLPNNFKIGVIVGSSGSGKSTLLKHFGSEEQPIWNSNKSVLSYTPPSTSAINDSKSCNADSSLDVTP